MTQNELLDLMIKFCFQHPEKVLLVQADMECLVCAVKGRFPDTVFGDESEEERQAKLKLNGETK